jgi:AcrR family transcriptional regulator
MARAKAIAKKEPLSAQRIEMAALELIERDGLNAFSIRKLAACLGCEAMSTYHYFPSKDHLMDALVDRVMGNEMTVLSADRGGNWRAVLEASAREWRGVALRHPHFFNYLIMHRLNTPRALKWLNGLLDVFRGIGIGDEAAVRMFRVLGFYLAGALIEETAGYWRGHSTVAPIPDDVMGSEFPNVVLAGQWFREEHWERTFELGLKVFLDGVEGLLRQARRRPD